MVGGIVEEGANEVKTLVIRDVRGRFLVSRFALGILDLDINILAKEQSKYRGTHMRYISPENRGRYRSCNRNSV